MRRTRLTKWMALTSAVVALPMAGVAVAATKTVHVKHNGNKWAFSPATLHIKKGATVKWRWSGKIPHNVTGKGFSSNTATKLTFKHRFTKAGTYRVVCTIHQSFGQKMTIRVK